MATSGTNKTTSGFPLPQKNPRPEGRFMVYLGKRVEDVASMALDDDAVDEVLAEVAGSNAHSTNRV